MNLLSYLRDQGTKTADISLTLFKLMIPIIIVIKILEEMGLVVLLSQWLAPLMELVGLPGAMGLVWATALMTNLYGGIVVYASLAPDVPMSVAQVTIVSTMMLIAHALPVEARIAQKAGVNIGLTLALRLGMAVAFAWLADIVYRAGGWLQQPSELIWTPAAQDDSLAAWVIGQVEGLVLIVAIVFALVVLLDVLQRLGIIQWINRMLRPVLHLLGIGREAETITLVGLTLGISYGGALLINEARAGHVKPNDVLFSVSLLGLSHSLIEDTLLMMVIGGHLSGILVGRVAFTLIVIYLMVKLVQRCSATTVRRYLVRSVC